MPDKIKRLISEELKKVKSGNSSIEDVKSILEDFKEKGISIKMTFPQYKNINEIAKKIKSEVVARVSEILKMSPSEISSSADLSVYGMNSIYVIELSNILSEAFNLDLKPSVFYSQTNIDSFVNHLVKNNSDHFVSLYGLNTVVQETKNKTVSRPKVSKKVKDRSIAALDKLAPLDIAVVGMSCIMPDSEDLNAFWNNIVNSKDMVSEVPNSRWNWKNLEGITDGDNAGALKYAGFIPDVDKFDADFFGISPREAEYMDPQQRLFLQTVWSCLEHAGYRPASIANSDTGLYVGVATNDYLELLSRSNSKLEPYMGTGLCHSILVNRVSYFLDIKGPSEAIDTACSSSLVALHKAANAIRNGECSAAIVGGVNLVLTPSWHVTLSKAGMLSPTGRCKSFDAEADGYVRGEGVGAVYLKPLENALEDGDFVWGVIKGSAQNHGGKVSSLTVPCPHSQADLIYKSFKRAGFSSNSISYIEAHGTGTKLGDPIEVDGLREAFTQLASDDDVAPQQAYCAIGSAKSSIGHLETAAGIAGLIKTLLGFKEGVIPGNIHLHQQNPYIDIDKSPFYFATSNQSWDRLKDKKGMEVPRRAGISSFGFGGVNAHIAVEEFRHEYVDEISSDEPQLLALSAKNDERLAELVINLLNFIENGHFNKSSFNDFIYTLNVGREQWNCRLAIVCNSFDDLKSKLLIARDKSSSDAIYSGYIDSSDQIKNDLLNELNLDNQLLDKFLNEKNWDKVGQLWIAGLNVEWDAYYSGSERHRLPLPTYPFSKSRHWADDIEDVSTIIMNRTKKNILSGLIDSNSSTFAQQQYCKTLSPGEFYLRDHVVDKKNLLPGVAYLEMALVAGNSASIEGRISSIRNIFWLSPLFVEKSGITATIQLSPDNDSVKYSVVTSEEDSIVTHGMGELCYTVEVPEAYYEDISAIENQCPSKMEAESFYQRYNSMGIEYGESFQSIESIYYSADEAVARFSLAQNYRYSENKYFIHPAVMDAAFQAALIFFPEQIERPFVPFSASNITIYKTTPFTGAAHLELINSHNDYLSLNIRIFDEFGECCIEVEEFTARPLRDPLEGMHFTPLWKPQPLLQLVETGDVKNNEIKDRVLIVSYKDQHSKVIECLLESHSDHEVIHLAYSNDETKFVKDKQWLINFNDEGVYEKVFQSVGQPTHIYYMGGLLNQGLDVVDDQETISDFIEYGPVGLFRLLKYADRSGWLQQPIQIKTLTSYAFNVSGSDTVIPYGSALAGLSMSLGKEYEQAHCVLIDLPMDLGTLKEGDFQHLAKLIRSENGDEEVVAIRNNKRFVRRLCPTSTPSVSTSNLKENGTYVIVGGAGGIGTEIGSYFSEMANANIAIIGRREFSQEIKESLKRISNKGNICEYYSANLLNQKELSSTMGAIRQKFGRINGVIHSAIVLRDQSIARMDENTFRAAFDPKYTGSLNLYRVIKDDSLDFLLFLSSAQSFWGNAGQANYAAGCTFKDSIAIHFDQISSFPVRVINWGYWGGVGVVASDKYRQMMKRAGIGSVEISEGMETIHRSISGYLPQIVAMKAENQALKVMGVDNAQKLFAVQELPNDTQFIKQLPQVKESLPNLYSAAGLEKEAESFYELEKFGELATLFYFQRQSVFLKEDGIISRQDILSRTQVIQKLIPALNALLNILATKGYIKEIEKNIFSATSLAERKHVTYEGLEEIKNRLVSKLPMLVPHLNLVWECIDNMPGILNGEVLATNIIFPDGKMDLVQGIYQGATLPNLCNQLVAESIKTFVGSLSQKLDRKVRIMEVGSGTGGTTGFVLKALQPYADSIEYTYTDISRGFLNHGERKFFAENPFMKFQIFDLEKSPLKQGFPMGGIDIVFGSNVIHATVNMNRTLRNIKQTLNRGGVLLINEVTEFQAFATLTFGMLDGWWLYDDADNRIPHSPLLTCRQWRKALKDEGYAQTDIIGESNDFEHNYYPQCVIVSESNGLLDISQETTLEKNKSEPKTNSINKQKRSENTLVKKSVAVTANANKLPAKLDNVKDVLVKKLILMLVEVLKLPKASINGDTSYESIGIDSIVGIEVTNKLRQDIGEIPTTALFEFTTTNEVADYLLNEHEALTMAYLQIDGQAIETEIKALGHSTKTVTPLKIPMTKFRALPSSTENQNINTAESIHDEPIAIISIDGRFPESENMEAFWNHIASGENCISEVPKDRWDWNSMLFDKPGAGSVSPRFGGFIKNIFDFDSNHFQVTPEEAEHMSPEERIFLESIWRLMETSGYTRDRLRKLEERSQLGVGVFVGSMYHHYPFVAENTTDGAALASVSHWAIANRTSWFLNIHGPSMAVDTACSSSLMAIHLACESLKRGECIAAIAGGVNLSLHPGKYQGLCESGMLSKGNKSAALGDSDGMLPGEGVGSILLKPLSVAKQDGDNIAGVILASGVNHGGRTGGFMVPNSKSQSSLIVNTIKKAGILPESISYIDLAANGAPLGDAIEFSALKRAYSSLTDKKSFCAVGSVKSNIGHLEACSGLSQLGKCLLQFRHKKLVPSINAEQLNPDISFTDSPFYLQKELKGWDNVKNTEGGVTPRRAAINSIGAGGTNVHIILEEAPAASDSEEQYKEEGEQLFVFSAPDAERLRNLIAKIIFDLNGKAIGMADLAYTLSVGREHMAYRLAIIANSVEQLTEQLNIYLENDHGQQISDINQSGDISFLSTLYPLIEGPAEGSLIEKLYIDNEKSKIAWFWVRGVEIDWSLYLPDSQCRIVPNLSGIEFNKRRCHINDTGLTLSPRVVSGDVSSDDGYVAEPLMQSSDLEFDDQLLHIVSSVTGFKPNELSVDQPLVDYGITSIQALRIKSKIEETNSIDISIQQFFECATIRACSALISSLKNGDNRDDMQWPTTGFETLFADSQLTKNLSKPTIAAVQDLSRAKQVLVTGATGLLGVNVVYELIQRYPHLNVVCLVRSESFEEAQERLINTLKSHKLWTSHIETKVTTILGDISLPQLGLSDKPWIDLCVSTDAIFHCAASVNHALSYNDLRSTNVLGIIELVKLARTHQLKALNFVSSVAVNISVSKDEFLIEHEDIAVDLKTQLTTGYAESKVVGEHLLLNALEGQLPVSIIRPGEIAASSVTGTGQADDIFHKFLQLLHSSPNIPDWEGACIDVLPVNTVAKIIVASHSRSKPGGWICNLSHPRPRNLIDHLKSIDDRKKVISLDKWAKLIRYDENQDTSHNRLVINEWIKNYFGRPFFTVYFQSPNFDLCNLNELIKHENIVLPELDENLFNTIFCINREAVVDVENCDSQLELS